MAGRWHMVEGRVGDAGQVWDKRLCLFSSIFQATSQVQKSLGIHMEVPLILLRDTPGQHRAQRFEPLRFLVWSRPYLHPNSSRSRFCIVDPDYAGFERWSHTGIFDCTSAQKYPKKWPLFLHVFGSPNIPGKLRYVHWWSLIFRQSFAECLVRRVSGCGHVVSHPLVFFCFFASSSASPSSSAGATNKSVPISANPDQESQIRKISGRVSTSS